MPPLSLSLLRHRAPLASPPRSSRVTSALLSPRLRALPLHLPLARGESRRQARIQHTKKSLFFCASHRRITGSGVGKAGSNGCESQHHHQRAPMAGGGGSEDSVAAVSGGAMVACARRGSGTGRTRPPASSRCTAGAPRPPWRFSASTSGAACSPRSPWRELCSARIQTTHRSPSRCTRPATSSCVTRPRGADSTNRERSIG